MCADAYLEPHTHSKPMPPATVISKGKGKAKKVVPTRLPKGIKGTENDPALLKEPYKKVVSYITKPNNVW